MPLRSSFAEPTARVAGHQQRGDITLDGHQSQIVTSAAGQTFTQGPTVGQLLPVSPPCHLLNLDLDSFITAWTLDVADWPSPGPVGTFAGTRGWVDPNTGDVYILGNLVFADAASYMWRWPVGTSAFEAPVEVRPDPPGTNTSAGPTWMRWNKQGSLVISGAEGVDIGGGDIILKPWVNLNGTSSQLDAGNNRDYLDSNSCVDSLGAVHTVASRIENDALPLVPPPGTGDRYWLVYGEGLSSSLPTILFDPAVAHGTIQEPRIFADLKDDTLHVIFHYLGNIFYCKKLSGGSFTTPIDTGLIDIRTFGYGHLDVAAIGDYVVIHSMHTGNGTYYVHSEDKGDTWNAPVLVDTYSPGDPNRDLAHLWANDCMLGFQRLYDDNFDPPRSTVWMLGIDNKRRQILTESIDTFSSGSNGMSYYAQGLFAGDIVYLRRGTQWARRKHAYTILYP